MRLLALLAASACLATSASTVKPKVSVALVTDAAQRLDAKISRLMPDDPVMPIGLTQGAYIPGIGAVFMGSVNLAPTAGITPFHQSITKEEILRIHQKKVARVPKLKEMMQEVLSSFASSMDPIPADEQIAIAITLFYFNGEDTTNLPAQIVMRGQKKAILDTHGSAIQVDQF